MQVQAAKVKVKTYFALFTLTFALVTGCAVKTAPPLPSTLKYPEFVYPSAVPAAAPQAAAVDRGWRFLQNDDLANADREFAAAMKAVPDFAPARTGEGYLALARQDYMRALDQFELALRAAPSYAPNNRQRRVARGRGRGIRLARWGGR